MESRISFWQTLLGAFLSQRSIGVVCGAIFKVFWGFMRLFVVGSMVFHKNLLRFGF